MERVKGHYDRFLASVYSWILGDFENARQKNASFFETLALAPAEGAIAVDLGCGPGCQSIPLAEAGYQVLAIDFCQELLNELQERASTLPVRTVCDDLRHFRSHMSEPADLIVCMGDTLVHLPDEAAADAVIRDVCESLKPGGRFIYAIRDYVSGAPEGADRFIPIRASDDQIFTCFVDFGDDSVHVHDILWRRVGGDWTMRISDYHKLRLDCRKIDRLLEAGGLAITSRVVLDGMTVTVAEAAN